MSDKLRWITHNDKPVLICDFSDMTELEMIDLIDEISREILKTPTGDTIRSISIATGSFMTSNTKEKWIEFIQKTSAYHNIVAIVGVSGFGRLIAQFFNKSTHFAKSLEEALEWAPK